MTVPHADLREYLVNYLSHPRWRGKPWAQVAAEALMPVNAEDRAAFTALVQARRTEIVARLDRIDQLDQEIDQRVLALYGISDPAEQARVLGSAPIDDEAAEAEEEQGAAAAGGEMQAGQAEGEE